MIWRVCCFVRWLVRLLVRSISLKRVKIDEKLLWTAYRNLLTVFRTVPSPTPYGLSFPKLKVRNPHSKLQSKISVKRVLIEE